VSYLRNNRMSELLAEDLETAPEDQQAILYDEMKVYTDLADANRGMFDNQFLSRDGSYSVQRQLSVMWADAAREHDMDYASQFKAADDGRADTRNMLISVMVLTISTVFYSLVESSEKRSGKIVLIALGSLVAVIGIVMAALVQFGVW